MGELISAYVLEERWVGLNVWQLEEDGCVSDSKGVYARDHDSRMSQAGLLFLAGCWEILLEDSKKNIFLQVYIFVDGLWFNLWHSSWPHLNPSLLLGPAVYYRLWLIYI